MDPKAGSIDVSDGALERRNLSQRGSPTSGVPFADGITAARGGLHEAARWRGVDHISLSVESANPASALYRAEGYRIVGSREHVDTMLLDLQRGGAGNRT